MKSALFRALGVVGCAGATATVALGQGWSDGWCHPDDPLPPPPAYSIDFGANVIGNDLLLASLGIRGTVTWGSQDGPCYDPAVTMNARGRLGFLSGIDGSIQSNFDDLLAYVTGALFDVSGAMSYATSTRDGTRTLYGANGWNLAFVGESDRYLVGETTNDNTYVALRMDVVGDAARLRWRLTNLGTETAALGLWYGAWTGMVGQFSDATGERFSGARSIAGGKNGYVYPRNGEKPVRTDQRYIRALDVNRFPPVVDFMFGQTTAYGLRVETGATVATTDSNGQSDATEASEFALGNNIFMLGPPGDQTFPDFTVEDLFFLDDPAFILKFAEVNTAPQGTREIIHWMRSTWSEGNYAKPYAVILDAPKLLSVDNQGANGLTPNPFTIRVYVDNIRAYTTVNEEIPLQDTKVKIILPTGLTLEPGETAERLIGTVPPYEIRSVDYRVRADGEQFGALAYRITVDSLSVPNNPPFTPEKVMTGTIQVSATPKLRIAQGANLITTPWIYGDTSWETILAMQQPQDFQAFDWNATQQGYVVSTSAQRAVGTWIIAPVDYGYRQLAGNPQVPGDIANGAPLTQIKQGWNLIGNPYPYAFPLGQIVGISGANNQEAFRWAELVQLGFIEGYLAYWDINTQSYKFIQGNDALLQPNTGYWIYLNTVHELTISWPAIFEPFLPGSNRARWQQSDSQWRVQLVANSTSSVDDWNYVGQAKDAASAKSLRTLDAPMGPTQMVNVTIGGLIDGKPVRLAQSMLDARGRKEWSVFVDAKEAGPVTLTWPNATTVPRGTRLKLVDMTNNQSRDMRRTSGYTFVMQEPGVREFKVQVEPGGSSSATITNIAVGGGGRAPGSGFTISYTLSGPATTTVRVLSGAGKEVYVAARGRADSQGQNQVTWGTRDSAGRSVAPGVYKIEIVVETEDGQLVRKTVPVNVIR